MVVYRELPWWRVSYQSIWHTAVMVGEILKPRIFFSLSISIWPKLFRCGGVFAFPGQKRQQSKNIIQISWPYLDEQVKVSAYISKTRKVNPNWNKYLIKVLLIESLGINQNINLFHLIMTYVASASQIKIKMADYIINKINIFVYFLLRFTPFTIARSE